MFGSLVMKMSRKKTFESDSVSESNLARVLTIFDLVGLGVGSTLGLGVYVMAGSVSKEEAGPGIAISFVIAAIASLFAGLCYAEFGARVPRAGSAYVYSYVTIGEFIAFLIGWNLILEYVIGTASVVRGLTGYIDSLANNAIGEAFRNAMPMNVSFLSSYPDFFAFGLTMLLAVALAFGVKESSIVNNIMTITNVGVIIFAIIAGLVKADIGNWQIAKEDIPEGVNGGEGGFVPFGIIGIIKGAATCFYAFVGFDCVATTGEEAINPQRNIPLAIVISLAIVFLCYFGISSVLTLMLPYYLQDTSAPLSYAFEQVGWDWARWIVSIGAIFGLTASFFGALFPLPRIIYAMSSDGLLFKFMGKIHQRLKTPFIGTILSGLLTAIMALIFDVDQLVSMMSIGTLLAYSIVAACVLLLRYTADTEDEVEHQLNFQDTFKLPEKKKNIAKQTTMKNIMRQLFNIDRLKHPTDLSTSIAGYQIIFFFVLCLLVSQLIIQAGNAISEYDPLAISGLVILILFILCALISIGLQPVTQKKLNFKVPFVPLVPALSIFANIYLMMMLDIYTWIRFAVWIVVGLIIYFAYGMNNSKAVYRKTTSSAEGIDNMANELLW